MIKIEEDSGQQHGIRRKPRLMLDIDCFKKLLPLSLAFSYLRTKGLFLRALTILRYLKRSAKVPLNAE